MFIYQILENGYLGEIKEIDDSIKGIPLGWTRTRIPFEITTESFVIWSGSGWEKTSMPPQEPVVPEESILPEEPVSTESDAQLETLINTIIT